MFQLCYMCLYTIRTNSGLDLPPLSLSRTDFPLHFFSMSFVSPQVPQNTALTKDIVSGINKRHSRDKIWVNNIFSDSCTALEINF